MSANVFNTCIRFLFNFSIIVLMILTVSFGGTQTVEAAPFLQTFDCSVVPPLISLEECQALVALYDSTGGSSWANQSNWLVSPNPDDWYGIVVRNGHVEELLLGNNNLSGSMPTAIGDLTGLRSMYLWDNQITGEMPASITNLVNLTEFGYDCTISSSDPLVVEFLDGLVDNYCIYIDPTMGDDNWISVSGWPSGTTSFQITIDDPGTPEAPDFTTNRPADGVGSFFHELQGDYNIHGGDLITVTGGGFSKQVTVADIEVTSIDVEEDIVLGRAGDGINRVWVRMWSTPYLISRWADVQLDGTWAADFSVPGTGPEDSPGDNDVWDLQPGDNGIVRVSDAGRNTTRYYWAVTDPILALPDVVASLTYNQIYSENWMIGSNVTLTIDDASNGPGIDFTDSGVVGPAPWGDPQYTWVEFFPDTLELAPGDIVILSGNSVTKELIIQPLGITGYDVVLDTVSGTAEPGETVAVFSKGGRRDAIADANGNWEVNFSIAGSQTYEQRIVDLTAGTIVGGDLFDSDGDYTEAELRIPRPSINVLVNSDRVGGNEWPLGITLNIEVDDPATSGLTPDFAAVSTVGVAEWDPNQTWFEIGLDGYDLKTGDVVTITGGGFSKQLTVQELVITEVDLDTDTVYGVAPPNQQVEVVTCYTICINQNVTADQDGNWSSSFSSISDESANIRGGSWVAAIVYDEDWDITRFAHGIPNPAFGVRENDNRIEGWQWPLGATVTIMIDDPSTPTNNPDFSGSTTVVIADWNPNET